MSKSLGNFFTVRDLLDQGVPGEVIRFVFLSTHYRKPMDWTEKKRAEAEKKLRKWRKLSREIQPTKPANLVVDALKDDLNSSEALRRLDFLANALQAGKLDDPGQFVASANLLGLLDDAMGGWSDAPVQNGEVTELIESLLLARTQARAAKDFARSDVLRDGFAAAGVLVKDTADGAVWELAPNFDLETLKLL